MSTFSDIEEDICPQREGYDTECDTRCGQLYPMRIGSGCRTRQTGETLQYILPKTIEQLKFQVNFSPFSGSVHLSVHVICPQLRVQTHSLQYIRTIH